MTNVRFFENVKTIEELKIQYKKLARKLHPDMENGNAKDFIAMKEEYDKLYKILEKSDGKTAYGHKKHEEKFGSFQSIIDKLIFMENGEIEICGSWIWVSKIGFEHVAERELLKSMNFEWSKGKKSWYLGSKGKFWKKGMSMDNIRNEFGSEKIEKVEKPKPKKLEPIKD